MRNIFKKTKREEFRFVMLARNIVGLENYPLLVDLIHVERILEVETLLGTQFTTGGDGRITMSKPAGKRKEKPSYVV